MAIYQLLLRSLYQEQEALNRWFYISSGAPGTASGAFSLASAFGLVPTGSPPDYPTGTLFDVIRSIQVDAVTYTEAQVSNLYDPVDFYVQPFNVPARGADGGDGESPAIAWGLRTTRTRLDIRRGYKRFVGVSENGTLAGGKVSEAYLTILNNIATFMSDPLNYSAGGASLVFNPAILSFEKYVTPRGNDAYRKYETEAEQLAHSMIGFVWTPYLAVRTQGSRQYGRGS